MPGHPQATLNSAPTGSLRSRKVSDACLARGRCKHLPQLPKTTGRVQEVRRLRRAADTRPNIGRHHIVLVYQERIVLHYSVSKTSSFVVALKAYGCTPREAIVNTKDESTVAASGSCDRDCKLRSRRGKSGRGQNQMGEA